MAFDGETPKLTMEGTPLDPELRAVFDGIFAEFFARRPPTRRISLVVTRGYRGTVETTVPLALRRRKACAACEGGGCGACAFVGWTVTPETVRVTVSKGMDVGTVLQLPGAGDDTIGSGAESADIVAGREGRVIVTGGALEVEIVEEGERAEELRAAQRAHEASLEADFTATKARIGAQRARSWKIVRGFLVVAAIAGVVFGAIGLEGYVARAPLAAACAANADCRSGLCITVRDEAAARASAAAGTTGPEVASYCSSTCVTSEDCPSTMSCANLVRGVGTIVPYRVCVPRLASVP